jgi:hypothetical protein
MAATAIHLPVIVYLAHTLKLLLVTALLWLVLMGRDTPLLLSIGGGGGPDTWSQLHSHPPRKSTLLVQPDECALRGGVAPITLLSLDTAFVELNRGAGHNTTTVEGAGSWEGGTEQGDCSGGGQRAERRKKRSPRLSPGRYPLP